jgi:hypothetical protein
MIRTAVRVLASLVLVAASFDPVAAAQTPASECDGWEECRDRALEARAAGQYERFHDLAWRAVQTAPPNDPALMYLLARAQALSGRRRDALVMLRRLADMRVPTEAATEEDFRRTRELPGWVDIESRFERLRNAPVAAAVPAPPAAAVPPVATARPAPSAALLPGPEIPRVPPAAPSSPVAVDPAAPSVAAPSAAPRVAAAPAPAVAAAAPAAAPVPPPPVIEPLPSDEVARFASAAFAPAGIAYDEVSRRFLFGDTRGRRLFVVGEGSSRTVDLVRGDAAGFHDVTAIEIAAAADRSAAALHRLQLISGRALATVPAPAAATIALSDVAVAGNGTVLVLDSGARRVLRLAPGAKTLETMLPLDLVDPVSLAVPSSDRAAYIAHATGIARVDLQQRSLREVTAAGGVRLAGFERLRWHRDTLVGIQRLPDGRRGLTVVQLDRAGTRATASRVIDPSLDGDARSPMLTVVDDDVYYSVVDGTPPSTGASTVDVRVRRIRLP